MLWTKAFLVVVVLFLPPNSKTSEHGKIRSEMIIPIRVGSNQAFFYCLSILSKSHECLSFQNLEMSSSDHLCSFAF